MSETQEHVLNIIEAEEMNPKFKYELIKKHGAEKLLLCFQCGTCTADCPISRFSDFYRPRKIARMVQLGLKDRLLSDDALWLCSTCFTCVDRCPQNVEITGIARVLRNMVVKERSAMPLVFEELALNLLQTGYVYKIPESRLRRREQRGLPLLPKPNLEHISKIFEVTGFSRTLKNVKTFGKVKS